MKGYCGDKEATAAMFDPEGFLHTGDIGYYDEDLSFFIVDRLKELIKYKGYQVIYSFMTESRISLICYLKEADI